MTPRDEELRAEIAGLLPIPVAEQERAAELRAGVLPHLDAMDAATAAADDEFLYGRSK